MTSRVSGLDARERLVTALDGTHDCLVNVDMGDRGHQPGWMVRVKEDHSKADESMFQSRGIPRSLSARWTAWG